MSHVRPASWQHWADTLKASKSTFKDKSVTHTSRTLFIAQVPHSVSVADLEAVFKPLDGFIAARRVRGMGFIDYDTKQQATDAIGRFQGHKFPGSDKGLLISYDKDDEEDRGGSSKRQAEELRRRRQELEDSYTKLYCYVCSHFALKLTVTLPLLPVRKTDSTRVVNEKQLVSLDMAKGVAKAIKREKGVERQYWLNCMQCDAVLAYRSTPFGKPAKYIYLHEGAMRDDKMQCGTLRKAPVGLLAAQVADAVAGQAAEANAAAAAAAVGAAAAPAAAAAVAPPADAAAVPASTAGAESAAADAGASVGSVRGRDDSGDSYEQERAAHAKRMKASRKELRPGDWFCKAALPGGGGGGVGDGPPCGAHNYASRQECFSCGAVRPPAPNQNTAVADQLRG